MLELLAAGISFHGLEYSVTPHDVGLNDGCVLNSNVSAINHRHCHFFALACRQHMDICEVPCVPFFTVHNAIKQNRNKIAGICEIEIYFSECLIRWGEKGCPNADKTNTTQKYISDIRNRKISNDK